MGRDFELSRQRFDAVLADLDGVVTDTAILHAQAWKRVFDAFLADRCGPGFRPFDAEEYRELVDGRPRFEGVRAFLAARELTLPEGPVDATGLDTVHGLGNRKRDHYLALLDERGVPRLPTSILWLRALRRHGYRLAVVTASRNGRDMLATADLEDLFDVIVDGNTVADQGLAGKPDAASFRYAAQKLEVPPERAVVIEDAPVTAAQARAAGFGLTIGFLRDAAARRALTAAAHYVVEDLTDLIVAENGESDPADKLPTLAARGLPDRPLLLLDYDGTLTPIVDRPEQAVLAERARRCLAALRGLCPVAVVSGRDLATLDRLIDLDGIAYAGSHGYELALPDGTQLSAPGLERFEHTLAALDEDLARGVGSVPGVLVERKRYSRAVHYRQVPEAEQPSVHSELEALAERYPDLRLGYGKKVVEFLPAIDRDKGRAVQWLMAQLDPTATRTPVYFGDDITDEDAFRVVRSIGLGVIVGCPNRLTWASAAVPDTEAVIDHLERLAEGLREQA